MKIFVIVGLFLMGCTPITATAMRGFLTQTAVNEMAYADYGELGYTPAEYRAASPTVEASLDSTVYTELIDAGATDLQAQTAQFYFAKD